jgi:outer membrane protein OmpA-like peptidoglycan-associated protein
MKMKKLLLISALFLSSIASATHYYNYEFTPTIGYNITEGNINLDNYISYGGEIQWNNTSYPFKPEISFFQATSKYNAPISLDGASTDITRVALNGVYDLDFSTFVVPFFKLGLGYENFSTPSYSGNHNSFYADTGAGFKLFVTPRIALKAEALYLLKNNRNRYDNNLLALLGITFTFDQRIYTRDLSTSKKLVPLDDDNDGVINDDDLCLTTPAGVAVDKQGCALDDDKDGVANYKDKCPTTPHGVHVNKDGCELDSDEDGVVDSQDKCPQTPYGDEVDSQGCSLDSDKDGVLDRNDLCPQTPFGVSVDKTGCELDSDKDGVVDSKDLCPNTPQEVKQVDTNGCFKKLNLHITFKTGSAEVDAASLPKIEKFASFLKTVPLYDVVIVGHTDNVGTQTNNLKLSQKRAQRIKELLVEEGVASDSITTVGKGESEPIASNTTKQGRAQNRRIEAILKEKKL